jgi:flagellin
MVLSISTNTAALNVQRNLSAANEASASALAKLSSGSRVPTSKDDAASLAIGSRVEAEIAGLSQASTNASQATSLLQIADGAYGEISDILVRQSSLAIQSASGQLSDTERAILNTEFQDLTSEIDRISADTEFNGNQLINGAATSTITVADSAALTAAGLSVTSSDTTVEGNIGVSYDQASKTFSVTDNGTTSTYDATADLADSYTLTAGTSTAGVAISDATVAGAIDVTYNGTSKVFSISVDGGTAVTYDASTEITATGDFSFTAGGVTIDITDANFTDTADITTGNATATSALDAQADFSFTVGGETVAVTGATFDKTTDLATTNAVATAGRTNTASFDFQVGTGTKAQDVIAVSVEAVNTAALGTDTSAIDTKANALLAIDSVKTAIDTLQGSRASVGASLSRLDFASSNLSVSIENQSAAKAGLLDVDVATETTNFAAQQVIVQAGVSLLAQANQLPSQLLKLIG